MNDKDQALEKFGKVCDIMLKTYVIEQVISGNGSPRQAMANFIIASQSSIITKIMLSKNMAEREKMFADFEFAALSCLQLFREQILTPDSALEKAMDEAFKAAKK